MSRNFQCWEKDPFFSAAEQVQDSADRLESAFRAWIHIKSLSFDVQDKGSIELCRRELSTAFGIAKWQLEEFEKEVSVLYQELHVEDDASQRHQQFVEAISNQLSSIQNALFSSQDARDLKVLSTVSIAKEESDELAHFLCGSRTSEGDSAVDPSQSCNKADEGHKELPTSASLFSTSSGIDRRKARSGSLDECSSYQETHISRDTSDHSLPSDPCTSKGNSGNRHVHCIDRSEDGDTLLGDCYDSAGICVERANGHRRSASVSGSLSYFTERADGHNRSCSVGAGLSCCNEAGEHKGLSKYIMSGLPSNIWSSFMKTGRFVGSGVSQSVLKRWKDGEGDPMELCEMCDGDMEANCSTFLCQDGRRYKRCSELLQIFRNPGQMVSTRQIIQKITVVLAALGLLALYLY